MRKAQAEDINFGLRAEDRLLTFIQDNFGSDFKKTAHYAVWDYHNNDESMYIELKSRRCKHNQYPDTMVGYNKIKWAQQKPSCRFIILFNFTDGLYKWELDHSKTYKPRIGGTNARGFDDYKDHLYIPIEELSVVS